MSRASTLHSYLAEFVVVFVGVALAFAVDNLPEARNDRIAGGQYLSAFRQGLTADLEMLHEQQAARQAQLANARTMLEFFDDHMARDFDMYLYAPTFSGVPIQFERPWGDTPANRKAVETLLGDRRIENGLRLIVVNLDSDDGALLPLLKRAESQVAQLLQQVPATNYVRVPPASGERKRVARLPVSIVR